MINLVRQRKRSVESEDSIAKLMELFDVRVIRESLCNKVCDLLDVFFFQATSRDSRGANADSRWFHWAAGVEGDAVFVHGNTCFIEGV